MLFLEQRQLEECNIIEERKKTIQELQKELDANGSYEEWWNALEEFRFSIIKNYRQLISKVGEELYRKHCDSVEIGEGDDAQRIDHHIIGYLAPLNFKRISWGGVMRTPSEHIIELSNYFACKGKRFIYVALPCKGAVYPEIIADKELLNGKTINIPQWRKMIKEVCEAGVEVVDMFPVMRTNGKNLFGKGHVVSEKGAKIIADEIIRYLNKTIYGMEEGKIKLIQIGLFGNCNLQVYRDEDRGIYENLKKALKCSITYEGRYLPFCCRDSITRPVMENFLKKDILIYVGFPSGSFVRTSIFGSHRHIVSNRTWNTMDI